MLILIWGKDARDVLSHGVVLGLACSAAVRVHGVFYIGSDTISPILTLGTELRQEQGHKRGMSYIDCLLLRPWRGGGPRTAMERRVHHQNPEHILIWSQVHSDRIRELTGLVIQSQLLMSTTADIAGPEAHIPPLCEGTRYGGQCRSNARLCGWTIEGRTLDRVPGVPFGPALGIEYARLPCKDAPGPSRWDGAHHLILREACMDSHEGRPRIIIEGVLQIILELC